MTIKSLLIILSASLLLSTSCKSLREEDKVFHAGPVEGGLSAVYFGLYKGNKYKFCDGDFLDQGCYTGEYSLSGDTITLFKLKKHSDIPSNRFIIRRYREMDSTYWQWKWNYSNKKCSWWAMRESDSLRGAEGEVLPLNANGEAVLDETHYFLIRQDNLKNSH